MMSMAKIQDPENVIQVDAVRRPLEGNQKGENAVTTREKKNTHRKSAVIVGVLFIIATVFLFVGEAVYKPILSSPDYLEIAYPNRTTVITGVLLELICVLAMPLIAVFAFPVLKQFNEALAIGYIFFRALESVILIAVAEINKLSLIGVSEAYLNGDVDAAYMEAIGASIQANTHWGDTAGLVYNLAFIFGGFMFYTVLYQSRLIPRWMAAWGLIADVILLGGVLLGPFIEVTMVIELVVVLPIAVQEMVMAFWLILKGWNPDAFEPMIIERDSGRSDMTETMQPRPA